MRYGLSNWSLRNRLILSTLALAAIAITASDFAVSNSLRTFLINQADNQLNEVVQTSMLRLDRAGIDTANLNDDGDEYGFRPLRPLIAVPTTTAVTLLDISGNVVGQIGGEFANSIDLKEFSKLTPEKVESLKGLPFTIPGDDGETDIRAIARPLPSGEGTVVISVALDSVDRTVAGLSGIFILISFIVLISIAIVARSLIKLTLKPLNQIDKTASAIAD
jgi:two-component system OmpR family sensor kinase